MGKFILHIVSCVFVAGMTISDGQAMGQKTDQDSRQNPYKPAKWHDTAIPENDAAFALKNNDYRLLAFALRATNVPGIKPEQVQAYHKQCGLRFLKNFGDVFRSAEDLKRMKQAREYALRYNAVITSECKLRE